MKCTCELDVLMSVFIKMIMIIVPDMFVKTSLNLPFV